MSLPTKEEIDKLLEEYRKVVGIDKNEPTPAWDPYTPYNTSIRPKTMTKLRNAIANKS